MNEHEAWALLAAEGRRQVLVELLENDGSSTVDEIARRIASRRDERARRTELHLFHLHLPKLADHGAVEYDRRNGDVVLTDAGEELRSVVEAAERSTESDRRASALNG